MLVKRSNKKLARKKNMKLKKNIRRDKRSARTTKIKVSQITKTIGIKPTLQMKKRCSSTMLCTTRL